MSLEERILDEVAKHKVLYNPLSISDTRMRMILRHEAHNEVAKALGVPAGTVKTKWRNLRDCYIKHLRALDAKNKGLAFKTLYVKYRWADKMSFLNPHLKLKRIVTDDRNYSNADETDRSVDPIDYENTSKTEGKPMKFIDCGAHCQTQLSTNQNSFESSSVFNSLDDIDLLFLSYAKTVKKFPALRQVMIKEQVHKIIVEEELAHMRTDNAVNTVEESFYDENVPETEDNDDHMVTYESKVSIL